MEVDRPATEDIIRDPRKLAGEAAEEEGNKAGVAVAGEAGDSANKGAHQPGVQTNRNRCFKCTKKVGFTGLECRCKLVFCSKHRYPEEHNCQFDFCTADRAQLAKTVVGGGKFNKVDVI